MSKKISILTILFVTFSLNAFCMSEIEEDIKQLEASYNWAHYLDKFVEFSEACNSEENTKKYIEREIRDKMKFAKKLSDKYLTDDDGNNDDNKDFIDNHIRADFETVLTALSNNNMEDFYTEALPLATTFNTLKGYIEAKQRNKMRLGLGVSGAICGGSILIFLGNMLCLLSNYSKLEPKDKKELRDAIWHMLTLKRKTSMEKFKSAYNNNPKRFIVMFINSVLMGGSAVTGLVSGIATIYFGYKVIDSCR